MHSLRDAACPCAYIGYHVSAARAALFVPAQGPVQRPGVSSDALEGNGVVPDKPRARAASLKAELRSASPSFLVRCGKRCRAPAGAVGCGVECDESARRSRPSRGTRGAARPPGPLRVSRRAAGARRALLRGRGALRPEGAAAPKAEAAASSRAATPAAASIRGSCASPDAAPAPLPDRRGPNGASIAGLGAASAGRLMSAQRIRTAAPHLLPRPHGACCSAVWQPLSRLAQLREACLSST
jgi:hypothetical protein